MHWNGWQQIMTQGIFICVAHIQQHGNLRCFAWFSRKETNETYDKRIRTESTWKRKTEIKCKNSN